MQRIFLKKYINQTQFKETQYLYKNSSQVTTQKILGVKNATDVIVIKK